MRLIHPITCLAALTALIPFFFSGCASAVGISDDSAALASVTITSSSPSTINEAVKTVFIREGFSVLSEKPDRIVLQQVGGKSARMLYGTTFNDQSTIMIQPQIDIKAVGLNQYRLDCDVYIVEIAEFGRKEPWRVIRNGKREYQKILREISEEVQNDNLRQLTP